MLLIHCPYCEEDRSELEFRHAGDAHIARPTNIADITDAEFEAFFFLRDNPKGLIFERWRHIHGCGRFFNAARDTVSDKFLMSYKAGEPKPDLSDKPKATEKTVETYEATEGLAK
ncbi:sarcosine oxidase subunit delta [Sinorhizobium sp. BG8]|uniref:sarcosine oxidase subunit delta n=1 Tax=Sinorhizobium sp. BG8 TaxID=2613773 RepID=UPI00193EAEBB|nr:sarcosine oxidase subunit delta [Sinorhizobium sp. BG8]QRM56704.1 sarcosine oxidase subunit delta [Sinorhizobium sp. BG8]